jgi:site-specific DNA-methyltransferase (adenine-specific)
LAQLEAETVDAVVTDPPYGLGFMGKGWDHGVPGVEFWAAARRVAKPGAHLVAFGGTRTHHRLMCAMEDAGWEIRDVLMWLYGSGFPKSLDVSKAIDKAVGAEPLDLGASPNWRESKRDREKNGSMEVRGENAGRLTAPVTDAAKQWDGWGTALKPAWEPIILARKPLVGTVAANVQAHGTGALNIDGCRITPESLRPARVKIGGASNGIYGDGLNNSRAVADTALGRWPANLVLDEDAAAQLDEQAPETGAFAKVRGTEPSRPAKNTYGEYARGGGSFPDDGLKGASRFFYCAKASRAERESGVSGDESPMLWSAGTQNPGSFQSPNTHRASKNHHPTVKPVALMRWLCRLVAAPGGLVLDPFMGSGSTGVAAVLEGFGFLGIEKEAEYVVIADQRIQHASRQPDLWSVVG